MNISVAEKLYKIGSVAACSGLSVKTVRYYEEMGLLSPAVKRSPAGYRLFGETVFNRLAFIKRPLLPAFVVMLLLTRKCLSFIAINFY